MKLYDISKDKAATMCNCAWVVSAGLDSHGIIVNQFNLAPLTSFVIAPRLLQARARTTGHAISAHCGHQGIQCAFHPEHTAANAGMACLLQGKSANFHFLFHYPDTAAIYYSSFHFVFPLSLYGPNIR